MNLRSGYPFWLIKSGLPFSYPKLSNDVKTDILVMGGGISGALAAYYLSKAGIQCIVVDGRTIGLGSTCASTALLQYEIDIPLTKLVQIRGEANAVRAYELCKLAIEKLAIVAADTGFTGFENKKSLYYAVRKKDRKFLEAEYALRKEKGFLVELLSAEELEKQFGFKGYGAILSQHGAQVNAYLFTHYLLQYGLQKGIQVYDRTPISNIRHDDNKVVLQTEDGHEITARQMIYATGYEVLQYIDKKIVELHSTYATISENIDPAIPFWKEEALIWNTDDPYLYMRTTQDRRIIVGGRDEKFSNAAKRDKLIDKKAAALAKDFNGLFPGIPFVPEFSWTGVFGSTKDGLPFIGPYKKLSNSYFALGFGGNGITFSQVAAEILTDLISGRKNSDAALFSFDRV